MLTGYNAYEVYESVKIHDLCRSMTTDLRNRKRKKKKKGLGERDWS